MNREHDMIRSARRQEPSMTPGPAGLKPNFMDADELAAALAKQPTGGHWSSGVAVLRNMA
jgi:hypothetical protein